MTPKSNPITVRDARETDAPFIVASNHAMASETEGRILDRETLFRGVSAVFAEPHRGFYLVAEQDGTPRGCLLVTPEWSDWRNGTIWWIQSVYVEAGHRGRGHYRALHEEVRRRGREDGIHEVRLYVDRENEGAREVYRRLGMRHSRYDLMEEDLG